MHEILAVTLICGAGIAGPDCTRDNALDVVTSPVRSAHECLMAGQVAASGLHLGEGEERSYVKVACERRRTAVVVEVAR